ncbi:S41 family peptidase [Pseudoduganella sp. OTU4001]|uniref:S41 family peptidase n=1 Tax=Pseudoduganella sp. OTU4001 TaxID=3043854 RepID=UPI00313E388C
MKFRSLIVPAILLALLAGCGGGGDAGTGTSAANATATTAQRARQGALIQPRAAAALPTYTALQNLCAAPRQSGGSNWYPDQQGTLDDEKAFLRTWTDETYLWYREVPPQDPDKFSTAVDYFNQLKTPLLTASGKPKDRYHFTYDTAVYDELSRGVELGYGLSWVRNTGPNIPRTWRVSSVVPGSPADLAGVRRGDKLEWVDSNSFIWGGDAATVAKLNAGLFPTKAGEKHQLLMSRGFQRRLVTLAAAKIDVAPVQNTKVIETPTGKVGYMSFTNHNAVSELQLIEAFRSLEEAKVNDLVLDLRYNGGGLLVIASQVAYMIAGPGPTSGKTFEHTLVNDKRPQETPLIFLPLSLALRAPKPAPYLKPLPKLDLKRVTILTGPGTCSASESIINGLRGVDVEVNLIGGQTCGKPYAFTPTPNCGTTYFTIQFQGVNHKGFGDFSDGFAPTCQVADDFTRLPGDPQEALLAAALHYRATGTCPAAAPGTRARAGGAVPEPEMTPVRPAVSEIAIYSRP